MWALERPPAYPDVLFSRKPSIRDLLVSCGIAILLISALMSILQIEQNNAIVHSNWAADKACLSLQADGGTCELSRRDWALERESDRLGVALILMLSTAQLLFAATCLRFHIAVPVLVIGSFSIVFLVMLVWDVPKLEYVLVTLVFQAIAAIAVIARLKRAPEASPIVDGPSASSQPALVPATPEAAPSMSRKRSVIALSIIVGAPVVAAACSLAYVALLFSLEACTQPGDGLGLADLFSLGALVLFGFVVAGTELCVWFARSTGVLQRRFTVPRLVFHGVMLACVAIVGRCSVTL
jgi:hypothetical protein